jgi:serine/threonine protein kinase
MPLPLGDSLGPFEILAPLGKGGMGEVYRARDTTLKRDVALKMLPAAFSRDPNRASRPRNEAEVLASLTSRHRSSLRLRRSRRHRGIAMEFVDGATLTKGLSRSTLPSIPSGT